MNLKNLRVNGKRLQSTLEQMGKIGATPGGGVQRLTLSDEDQQARDLFVKWLKEIDCEIIIDEMGNIFGRRPGRDNSLAPVMSGSHIDSQPKGGRFDGILGVAIAVAIALDLSINVSFNPARSLITDVTPEGAERTRGYTWMQTVSGSFGVLAYAIGAAFGNVALIYVGAGIVLLFSLLRRFVCGLLGLREKQGESER